MLTSPILNSAALAELDRSSITAWLQQQTSNTTGTATMMAAVNAQATSLTAASCGQPFPSSASTHPTQSPLTTSSRLSLPSTTFNPSSMQFLNSNHTTTTTTTSRSVPPVWMTANALEAYASQNGLTSTTTSDASPPPPTSTGSPIMNSALLNDAAAHLIASATKQMNHTQLSQSQPQPQPQPHPTGTPTAAAVAAAAAALANPSLNLSLNTRQQPYSGIVQNDLFSPFEQRYITDFLNRFSVDKTSDITNQLSPVLNQPTQLYTMVSPTPPVTNAEEQAYPSPEPTHTDTPKQPPYTPPTTSTEDGNRLPSPTVTLQESSVGSVNARKRTHDTVLDSVEKRRTSPAKRKRTSTPARKTGTEASKTSNGSDVYESAEKTTVVPSEPAPPPPPPPMKKELLTEEQKRVNHIRSEQKRRDAIRIGFQELSEIVPALQGARVSKSVMLEEAAAWITQLEADCRRLHDEIRILDAKVAVRRQMQTANASLNATTHN
jgi:hypothetical protein